MKSLGNNIFTQDETDFNRQFQSDLPNSRIEEIILKSIDDQESLFNQSLFHSDYGTTHHSETYAKEIINMCTGYGLHDIEYIPPTLDSASIHQKSFFHPSKRLSKQEREEKRKSSTETRPFICSYVDCTKAFKRFEHLKRHYRIHTGEKPFRCPSVGCNKSFSRSDNLMQHSKVHTPRHRRD
ncbi:hypothetical protein NEDG_01301 [Nematocida displodere]|uniref:C2H2-type domain-containing protein n=1 Tax=Nematocida displodere TaxID=1805483 RepID=A0A177EBN3_9MICR|nr:hypothetical protein NEDG_01301 [Nematocida displodere]